MGNLTRKPEVRYLQNGTALCKFGLAVNRRYKDAAGEWKEEPTFVDITFFGKRGEAFAKYHTKGRTAFIEGSLRLDNWEDREGNKRSKLYVVGDEWQFVGASAGGRQQEDYGDAPSSGGGGYDARGGSSGAASPGAASSGGGYSSRSASSGAPSSGGGEGSADAPPEYLEIDDTPF
jgi:single-strand DNA-binding protein